MNAQPSQGPWQVVDDGKFVRTVEAGRCIAKLDWDIRDDVDRANARLIACAPGMRDVLADLVGAWAAFRDSDGDYPSAYNKLVKGKWGTWDTAIDLLRKIDGEFEQ